MDCLEAREVLDNIHGFGVGKANVGEHTMALALEHIMVCPDCKSWAKNELCPKVKTQHDAGALSDDVYMLHGMLHGDGAVGGDCVAHF